MALKFSDSIINVLLSRLLGLSVTVRHETEEELKRCWVGIIRTDGLDMVRRRSVILHRGDNHLEIKWTPTLKASGRAHAAALYVTKDAVLPKYVSDPFDRKYSVNHEYDTITLLWTITVLGEI